MVSVDPYHPSRSACRINISGLAGALLLMLVIPTAAAAQSTTPGALTASSTIYSIGIEWDISGDADHDATVQVQYRVQGASSWKQALPLVRVDYNGRNMLAGSILFLSPGTTYEVQLSLSDPDGGADTRIPTVATRPVPTLPTGGRTFHVVPGAGGGTGTSADPFRGIAAAQAVALPKDIFLVHVGSYGNASFNRPGTSGGNYIVWKGAGDGEANFAHIDFAASYIWIEGLTVRDQYIATGSPGAPTDVVVSRNNFINNLFGIYLSEGGSNWYIADNTVVGQNNWPACNDAPSLAYSGEGIELIHSSGHTIAHNSISKTADGISYPVNNVDIFGNDIFDTCDDGIEGDGGMANLRIWGNRIHDIGHNAISFQEQGGAPWYVIRNQMVSFGQNYFKRGIQDRTVIAHNIIVNWAGLCELCGEEHQLFRSIIKNNLFISATGGPIWPVDSDVPSPKDWRTDFNYNGFDWGAYFAPFRYGNVNYGSVPAFSAATGLETLGIQIAKTNCLTSFNVPGPVPTAIPPQFMSLNSSCNAVDAGVVLPNINDGFVGAAPDLGAYEFGQLLPTYGPRLADPTPPTVSITAPVANAIVLGTIPVVASALDNVGVRGVQFKLDGTDLGVEDTAAPYTVSWNTVTAINGSHTLTAVARDESGNTAVSSAVPVTVNNPPDLIAPSVPTGLVAAAVSSFQINLTWSVATDNVGVAGYKVYRDGTQIATPTTTSYSNTGLSGSTTYSYTVAAFDAAGNTSAQSVPAGVTTPAPPPPDLIAYKAPGAITIDGNLADWGSANFASFGGLSNNAKGYLSWDATNLYAGFTVTDTQLGALQTTRDAADYWQDDSVEVFIDTLSDRASVMQPDDYQLAVNLANAQVDLRGTGSGKDWTWNATWASAVSRQGTLNNHGDLDSGYTVEIAIPWAQLGVTPAAGLYLGMDLTVNDSDPASATTFDYFDWALIAPNSYAQPSLWKRVQLLTPPDTTAPSVAIASPLNGATVSGTTAVAANASDNVAVAAVQFKLDGNNLGAEDVLPPFAVSWDTKIAANGLHTLTAVARDLAGNTGTASVSVTVFNDTIPPAVAVVTPVTGATIAGIQTVTADASDNVGVVGVQFKLDDINFGAEDTVAPYTVSFDTSTVNNGPHTLTAVARDLADNSKTSAVVNVTAVNREQLVIGLGSFPGQGGWLALGGNQPNAFMTQLWKNVGWDAYNASNGELHIATGDVDGDGLDEIVVGLGTGGDGWIAVLDDPAHGYQWLRWLQVNWPSYNAANGSVFPAVGDLDGDGRAEIIAGLGAGGGGWVEIFDDAVAGYSHLGWQQVPWSQYNAAVGETHPAVADLDGDGRAEIVLGLGSGGLGFLEVRNGAPGYDHRTWLQVALAQYNQLNGATFPAAGDVDGDGRAEIVVGLGQGGEGWLQVFDDATANHVHLRWLQVAWTDYNIAVGETHPAVGNLDDDNAAEIVIGLGWFVAGQGGWFEILDDANAAIAYRWLAWQNVGRDAFRAYGGGTFPSVAQQRR